jgi:hypothetical protein
LVVDGGGGVVYSPGPVEVGEVGEMEDTVGRQSVAAQAGLNVRRRGEVMNRRPFTTRQVHETKTTT